MATGGFKSNAPADFLEEWKAKREKMRAKMLGDIAKATGVPLNPASSNSTSNSRLGAPPGTELCTNPDRSASAGNCRTSSSSPVARSPSGGTLNRAEEEAHHPAAPAATTPTAQGSNLKKAPPQMEKTRCASPDSSSMMACNNDSDKDSPSPSPSKGKEKKNSGPSARKGKGQIEKRKLREKRRSTGVVSIPSNESLDELDDDDAGEKDRREEEELVQVNTFQNESMTADPATGYLLETPKAASGRFKSSARQGMEEEAGGNIRQRENRHSREGGGANLEKRVEELEKELSRLVKVVQDKDEVIEKLKEEIELLNLDLDEFEDENEQLKQENKTLLKVVGQLTR
ncbi:PRKC apoptosis WT1 regulator protein [Poecilia formosa]|uniref:PRKC apoptosis WT1 regulator protein n=1 Tax=Poecilia formosa TaxID=48698 RepID=UPI0004442122|nr:PREDICTED: PRKC apoptosis WT1 regulator protein [Poecilia formosa]